MFETLYTYFWYLRWFVSWKHIEKINTIPKENLLFQLSDGNLILSKDHLFSKKYTCFARSEGAQCPKILENMLNKTDDLFIESKSWCNSTRSYN